MLRLGDSRLLLTLLLGLVLSSILLGCGDSIPPENTLAALGRAVHDKRPDNTDFVALNAAYATPDYGKGLQEDLAKYQLFLAGKAAEVVLAPQKLEGVKLEKKVSGNKSTCTMVTARQGIFAAANIGTVTVEMTKTEDASLPWRISAVKLSR